MKTLFRMNFAPMITFCHTCGRATRHVAQPESAEEGRRYVEIQCERCQTMHRVFLDLPADDAKPADPEI